MTRSTLATLALLAVSFAPVAGLAQPPAPSPSPSAALAPAAPASASPAPPPAPPHLVKVSIPYNMRAGFVTTTPADDGFYYVSIPAAATNPSSTQYGWYEPSDFHLLVGDKTYLPVARPGLAALDLSWSGSVPPLGTLATTVTFKVPASVSKADFEFIPKNWYDNSGGSVVFCCLPQY